MSELNPCPFCGSTDLFDDDGGYYPEWEIRCMKCGGRIGFFDTQAEAIDAWNRRANDGSTGKNMV